MEPAQRAAAPGGGKRQRIGAAVRELRRRRGWSQDDLARQAGISTARLSRLERGASDPSYRTLCTLAEVLEVDLTYFSAFDQFDAELDRDLAAALQELAIPQRHWAALLDLSIEARGALLDALHWTIGAERGEPLREQELEQQILRHGVARSTPAILRALADYGMDAIELGRTLARQEELPGERLEINDRLPIAALPVPVPGGIDPVAGYRATYAHVAMSPRLVHWWAQAMHSAVKVNAEQFATRSIYPLRRIERYIVTGQWDHERAIAASHVRRQIGRLIEVVRAYPSCRIGLIDHDPPFNLLIKGTQQVCLFLRPGHHLAAGDSARVALRFSRPDLVDSFRTYFDELWESMAPESRDPAAVAAWLEQRLGAMSA